MIEFCPDTISDKNLNKMYKLFKKNDCILNIQNYDFIDSFCGII
jgi:hypothetical protein